MTPRTEALAFRIWAFAKPKDWDCTIHDIAAALEETPQRVTAVCSRKHWIGRLRSSGPFYLDNKIDLDAGEDWSSGDALIGEEEFVE